VAHDAIPQLEFEQLGVALASVQAFPQPLQLFGSDAVLTQVVPLQSVGELAGHPDTQA
jgi:hypothetical protein